MTRFLNKLDGGKQWPQRGLTGLALRAALLKGKPLVYLAYAYRFIGAAAKGDGSEPAYNEYRLNPDIQV